MDPGMVTFRSPARFGYESANRVVAVSGRECGGVTWEEDGGRRMQRAVSTSGAFDPNEIASGISDKE